MAARIFQRILDRAVSKGVDQQQRDSREWFRNEAQKARVTPNQFMSQSRDMMQSKVRQMDIGRMFMFMYDPKTKDMLPYYDRFPLVFPFKITVDGFYGLNMHYLPPQLRARLMDSLYPLVNNDKFDRDTRLIRISYDILNSSQRYKWFRPCVKRYLNAHCRSRFIMVHPSVWDIALMLPTQRFVKSQKTTVWRESRNAI